MEVKASSSWDKTYFEVRVEGLSYGSSVRWPVAVLLGCDGTSSIARCGLDSMLASSDGGGRHLEDVLSAP